MTQAWEGMADWQKLSEQFWRGVGEIGASFGGNKSPPPWGKALEMLSRFYQGTPHASHHEVFEKLLEQSRSYFDLLHGLYQNKGKLPSADEMKHLLGDFASRFTAEEPFQRWWQAVHPALSAMFPNLPQGFEQLPEEQLIKLLQMPTFGYAREHQERLQKFAIAVIQYERAQRGYQALIAKVMELGLSMLQGKLAAAAEPGGKKLSTPRELYDLLIDALEDAHVEVAMSPEFQQAYGKLVDAQMRVKAHVQKEVELVCSHLGIPTRTEVDAAHRKISELRRALRASSSGEVEALRREVAELKAAVAALRTGPASGPPAPASTRKVGTTKAVTRTAKGKSKGA